MPLAGVFIAWPVSLARHVRTPTSAAFEFSLGAWSRASIQRWRDMIAPPLVALHYPRRKSRFLLILAALCAAAVSILPR